MDEIVIRDDVPFPEITTKRGKNPSPYRVAMEGLKLGQSFETGPFSHEEAKKQSKMLSAHIANVNRRAHTRRQLPEGLRVRLSTRFVKETGQYFVGVWCVNKDSFKNMTNSNSTTGKNYGRKK